MRKLRLALIAVGFICFIAAHALSEEPQKVTLCQLQKDPAAFNHKLVEVEAFVSHDFEDFTIFDPACSRWSGVWLEYGGKAKSDTTYCCGPTAGRNRPQELTVENIPIPLIENDQFKQFDREIQPPFRSDKYGSVVHATIVGRFFAGRKEENGKGEAFWLGYGHMGCCSLLAIEEVRSVSPQDRDDLDYGASYEQLDVERVGCGPLNLVPLEATNGLIHDQQQADLGTRAWVFDDPRRVASDALIRLAKLQVQGPLSLKETRRAQGRLVYEWRKTPKSFPMMVIVSRPFLLSFYAKDPNHVAWVVVAAYELSCN
ncbi:MAG: hypothetical protein WA802_09350 [Terracidiphilus sp.]